MSQRVARGHLTKHRARLHRAMCVGASDPLVSTFRGMCLYVNVTSVFFFLLLFPLSEVCKWVLIMRIGVINAIVMVRKLMQVRI